jgi:hypothetical protein
VSLLRKLTQFFLTEKLQVHREVFVFWKKRREKLREKLFEKEHLAGGDRLMSYPTGWLCRERKSEIFECLVLHF